MGVARSTGEVSWDTAPLVAEAPEGPTPDTRTIPTNTTNGTRNRASRRRRFPSWVPSIARPSTHHASPSGDGPDCSAWSKSGDPVPLLVACPVVRAGSGRPWLGEGRPEQETLGEPLDTPGAPGSWQSELAIKWRPPKRRWCTPWTREPIQEHLNGRGRQSGQPRLASEEPVAQVRVLPGALSAGGAFLRGDAFAGCLPLPD